MIDVFHYYLVSFNKMLDIEYHIFLATLITWWTWLWEVAELAVDRLDSLRLDLAKVLEVF